MPSSLVAPAPARRAILATAVLAVVACATTVALGLGGSERAFGAGASMSAALAVAGGAGLVRRAVRRPQRLHLAAFGAAALLWGTGQGLIAARMWAAPLAEQVPTLGDAVCTAAAPLALLGLLAVPRRLVPRRSRLLLDAVLIASAGAAVVWQTAFWSVTQDPSGTGLAVVVLLADLSVAALWLLMAVSSLDRGLMLSAAGTSAFIAGDIVSTHALVGAGGTWPWQAAAAACLGWPLMCTGVGLIGRSGPAASEGRCPRASVAGPDVRTGTVTAVLVVGLAIALALIAGTGGEALDRVSAVLLVMLLALLGTREVIHQRQRGHLVRDLTDQARQDFLTSIGNRRALAEHLVELARGREPACVVVVDLDGFKEVNDRLGHAVGDQLLVQVARALTASLPAGWAVYRLGGDEFALVGAAVEEVAAAHARATLDGVRRAAASVAGVGIGQVPLSASAGVAQLPGPGGDPLDALSQASTAMQAAKQAGRDTVVLHAGELAESARRRAQLVRRLRLALDQDGLTVALQPIVDIATAEVTGFEVLSRWDDDELGTVAPDQFIAVAEETGLVQAIGSSALHRGLAAMTALGGVEKRLRLAVNASPLELRSPSYLTDVRVALQQAGVPADLLTVEVTEAIFVTRDDPAVATLRALADLGVRVSVDDFGTGYSSLAYLGRLPVHAVKIDRSLVAGLLEPRTRAVVEALVQMSRALDLDVVGEGVEDQAEADILLELGVQHGQGWLWSRARTVEELQGADHLPLAASRAPGGSRVAAPVVTTVVTTVVSTVLSAPQA